MAIACEQELGAQLQEQRSETGTWLRRQRERRCWSRSAMARRLIKAAQIIGDTPITSVDNLCHNIYRWERCKVGLSERYKLYYCHAFGIPVDQFGVDREESQVTHSCLAHDDPAIVVLGSLAGVMGLRGRLQWRDADHPKGHVSRAGHDHDLLNHPAHPATALGRTGRSAEIASPTVLPGAFSFS